MRKTIAALSLTCALLMPALAWAEGGPGAIDAFRQSHNEVTSLVDSKADPAAIQERVDELLDYEWIAKAALGGPSKYAEICSDRCDEFEALLTKLIRKNYLKRIEAKNRGTMTIVEEHVREKATKVDTSVTYEDKDGKTKTVEVDYVMHKVDGQWHVRDILTEGVSLAKNYKYEINRLYAKGGMDEVIDTLQKKVDSLEAEGK